MNWFLYERDLRHEWLKLKIGSRTLKINNFPPPIIYVKNFPTFSLPLQLILTSSLLNKFATQIE